MSETLLRTIRAALLTLLLFVLLACESSGFIVTLTPETTQERFETMTPLPTVVYPTLVPVEDTPTPTQLPDIECSLELVSIVCKATGCAVRYNHESGVENRAYIMPYGAVIDNVQVCECPTCAPFEQHWFLLGESGGKQYWALNMQLVWEVYPGDE